MLYVEQTLAEEVLPKLREQVDERHFREAVEEHIVHTREHVANVQTVFVVLEAKVEVGKSPPLDGLTRQHEELAHRIAGSEVRDLFHASSAAHTEHLEISAYHSLITLAALLGEPRAVQLLEHNLRQEEDVLEKVEKVIPERLTTRLVNR